MPASSSNVNGALNAVITAQKALDNLDIWAERVNEREYELVVRKLSLRGCHKGLSLWINSILDGKGEDE